MPSPVLADISNFPIQIDVSTMNSAYTNSQNVTLSDMFMSDNATNKIVSILRESYKASSGATLVDDPSIDGIYEEGLNISTHEILTIVLQSMSYSTIQTFGNTLSTTYMRDGDAPFQSGDIYTFPLVVRPGDFTVQNDTPYNISCGVTFFGSSLDGRPLLSNPGETSTISEWIYTTDALTGPYYEGTANDGFIVNMAIQMTTT